MSLVTWQDSIYNCNKPGALVATIWLNTLVHGFQSIVHGNQNNAMGYPNDPYCGKLQTDRKLTIVTFGTGVLGTLKEITSMSWFRALEIQP